LIQLRLSLRGLWHADSLKASIYPCSFASAVLHAGTLHVTRLLYQAACNTHNGIKLSQPSVMSTLACLPGAQAISADCIATVIHSGISHKRWQHVLPLLQLPGAKLISSQRLCQLILKAAQKKMMELFQKLCRCAAEAVWHLARLHSSMVGPALT
jgi:hypothetical protein